MDSMQYERGDKKVTSDASIALLSNVQVEKRSHGHSNGGAIYQLRILYLHITT